MKTVMADYRAKVKQKGSSSANGQALDEHHVKGPAIGGVLMGEKGKEILSHQSGNPSISSNEKNGRLV